MGRRRFFVFMLRVLGWWERRIGAGGLAVGAKAAGRAGFEEWGCFAEGWSCFEAGRNGPPLPNPLLQRRRGRKRGAVRQLHAAGLTAWNLPTNGCREKTGPPLPDIGRA